MRCKQKNFQKHLFKTLLVVVAAISCQFPISPIPGEREKSFDHELNSTHPAPEIAGRIAATHVPFIFNKGQAAKEVKFYAQTFAGTVFVTKDGEIVYDLPEFGKIEKNEKEMLKSSGHLKTKGGAALKEELLEASVKAVTGEGPAITKVNYFKGKHESGWMRNIPTYSTVSFGNVYEGIGLKLRAYGNNVEKIFFLQTGADPGTIRLKLTGADRLEVNESGELAAVTKKGVVTFTAPIAYQEINDEKHYIRVTYRVKGNEYGFTAGEYDRTRELIIDPLLASTFLGGDHDESISYPIALDQYGNVYVTGSTRSLNFPTTPGAYDESHGGQNLYDAYVSKFDSELTTLLASTFLGGGSGSCGRAIVPDKSGNLVVVGNTISTTFPTTVGAYDRTHNGHEDIFVLKLSNDLTTLLNSTFLGSNGIDYPYHMTLDQSGNVYVTGFTDSSNYPTTAGAYDETPNGNRDVIVSKLDSNLETLLASTFLGGNNIDYGYRCLTFEQNGDVYVTGRTYSSNFPTTGAAYDENFNGGGFDAFVSKFDSNLTSLLASTYLGGNSNEDVIGLTLDASGNVYVTGYTFSTNFPTTPGAYDESFNGTYDAFISKLDPTLASLPISTFIGGSSYDSGYSLALDPGGNVYVSGMTASPDFPTTPGAYDESYNGGYDAFVILLNPGLTTLFGSTYLGESKNEYVVSMCLDPAGDIYVTGWTTSPGFPATPGVYDEIFNGNRDVFISKLEKFIPLNTPPAAPTDLTAAPGPDYTVLTWNVNTEPDLEGYKVYRSLVCGMDYTIIATTTANSYTDSFPGNWDTFYYVVTAFDTASRESAFYNEVKAVSPTGQVDDISDIIINLPDYVFKNNPGQRKHMFQQKLDEITDLIAVGSYQEALNKIKNDILQKTDGCYGGKPNNDWITDCDAQAEIFSLILDLIALLETLL